VLPGPAVDEAEWRRCLAEVSALDSPPRFLALSGSLPPGVPVDISAQLARLARANATRVVLDTFGPALAAALDEGVFLVKPSLDELRELIGRPLASEAEWRRAALEIVQRGRARIVALSLGERRALLVSADQTLRAAALPMPVFSAVGAGDSFVAALVWALNRNAALDVAFRYGVAAASAALLSEGTGLGKPEDIARLYRDVANA
jgi:6-phosphofructokinase 2